MAKKTRKPKNRKSIIFRLCIFAFVAYSMVMLVDMQVTLAERKQEAEDLAQQVELKRVANKELERQLEMGTDEDYIEQVARDQLDYAYPDEQFFVDISGR